MVVSAIVNLVSMTTNLSHFDIDLNGNENWLLDKDDYKMLNTRKLKQVL
jgi:hypothetical protein